MYLLKYCLYSVVMGSDRMYGKSDTIGSNICYVLPERDLRITYGAKTTESESDSIGYVIPRKE